MFVFRLFSLQINNAQLEEHADCLKVVSYWTKSLAIKMIILFVRVQSSTGMILQVWQEWVTDSVFEVQFHKVLWKWDFCVILCFSVINAESCQKAAAFAAVSVGVRACCYCFYLMVFYTSGYGYFMLISYRWAPVCYLAHVLDWFTHIVKL